MKIEATAAEFEALRDDMGRFVGMRLSFKTSDTTKQFASELTSTLGQARKVFYPAGSEFVTRPDGSPVGDNGPLER